MGDKKDIEGTTTKMRYKDEDKWINKDRDGLLREMSAMCVQFVTSEITMPRQGPYRQEDIAALTQMGGSLKTPAEMVMASISGTSPQADPGRAATLGRAMGLAAAVAEAQTSSRAGAGTGSHQGRTGTNAYQDELDQADINSLKSDATLKRAEAGVFKTQGN